MALTHALPCSATLALVAVLFFPARARAQIVISGNERKIELTSGAPKAVAGADARADSLTVMDFSQWPPIVSHLEGVSNSVVGPPSNIAISPDGRLALVADSIRLDATNPAGFVPADRIHLLDLSAKPLKVIGSLKTDGQLQPSGISFTPDGKIALVANRASGTVSVLAVDGLNVKHVDAVKVGEPTDSISDVAVSPDGRLALASALKGNFLAVLKIEGGKVTATGRKIAVYGQPYRVVISPDGRFGLTAGTGWGNGLDVDALTVIDLAGAQPRTIDYVPLGVVPESIEISPDGSLVAAVCMEGSNLAPDNPNLTSAGSLVICERKDGTFVRKQKLAIGRIPEGVAFTSDGKYLVVQCHPDRQIWIFKVANGEVTDTGHRISTPGMPSSLRAGAIRK